MERVPRWCSTPTRSNRCSFQGKRCNPTALEAVVTGLCRSGGVLTHSAAWFIPGSLSVDSVAGLSGEQMASMLRAAASRASLELMEGFYHGFYQVGFLSTETTETMETSVPNGDKCRSTRAPSGGQTVHPAARHGAWQRVPQTLCHTRALPPSPAAPCHRLNTPPGYMSGDAAPSPEDGAVGVRVGQGGRARCSGTGRLCP